MSSVALSEATRVSVQVLSGWQVDLDKNPEKTWECKLVHRYSAKSSMDHKEHGFSSSTGYSRSKSILNYLWIFTLAELLL